MANNTGSARKRIVQGFIDRAVEQGWRVTMCGSGHLKFKSPDGPVVHIGGLSKGGGRSERNARSLLRRAGLKGL